MDIKSNIKCFILIEPGKGYIVPVLREKYPDSKIIVLHIDGSFKQEEECKGVSVFYGTEQKSLEDFLEKEITCANASLVKIIEWRPSLNFYKEAYVKILSKTVSFLKRLDAGDRTTEYFGRRWVKNFFKNLKLIKNPLLYRNIDIPVIITGAGPSLEETLPVIRDLKESCLLIAASSSVLALNACGIEADIIIATDGGSWALRHLYPYFRRNALRSFFAVSLCAALPSQMEKEPVLLMNDGSLWQNIVLHRLGLPSLIIPARGTVTASAVELALLLSCANIYLAGMDLSFNDLRTHVKPYGFDELYYSISCRLNPVYSQHFIRSSLLREGGSMGIYASWFKNRLLTWPKRIYNLSCADSGKHGIFENALPVKKSGIVNRNDYFCAAHVKDDPENFCNTGISALLAALKDEKNGEQLKQELSQLLFPRGECVTLQMIETEIIKMGNK